MRLMCLMCLIQTNELYVCNLSYGTNAIIALSALMPALIMLQLNTHADWWYCLVVPVVPNCWDGFSLIGVTLVSLMLLTGVSFQLRPSFAFLFGNYSPVLRWPSVFSGGSFSFRVVVIYGDGWSPCRQRERERETESLLPSMSPRTNEVLFNMLR